MIYTIKSLLQQKLFHKSNNVFKNQKSTKRRKIKTKSSLKSQNTISIQK